MSVRDGDAVIPSDFDGEYCCYAVMWPSSPEWQAVLRGVLTIPSTGRYWLASSGAITEAQEIVKATFDNNMHLEESIMSCNDPALAGIAEGLQQIAIALSEQAAAANNCCTGNGSGGAGQFPPPISDVPQGNPNTDDPPEGFESWEEFFSDKCAKANQIIVELRASLLRVGIINFSALSLDALAIALTVALTLAVPAAVIIEIVGLLISAGAEIIVASLLTYINDNETDLICALFGAENASQSYDDFHTVLGDAVDIGTADPVEAYAIKTLARYLVNSQVVNSLYLKDLTVVYPETDCSGCDENCIDCVQRFNSDGDSIANLFAPSDWFAMESLGEPFYSSLLVRVDGPQAYKMEFRNLVGWTFYAPAVNCFTIRNDIGTVFYSGNDFEDFAAACEANALTTGDGNNQIGIVSDSPFTWESRITIE